MQKIRISPDENEKYRQLLSELEFFKDLSEKSIKHLLDNMSLISIDAGEVLIHPDEDDRSMYVLISGRLQVKKNADVPSEGEVIAEITENSVVGEISLLTGKKRSALVFGIRDCLLLKLDKISYDNFEKKNCESALSLSKKSLERLVSPVKEKLPGEDIRLIAIAPAGDSDHTAFARDLYERLSQKHKTVLIDQDKIESTVGQEMAQSYGEQEKHLNLIRWIQSLENQYRYVIFLTDRQMTPWSERCLRCADYLMFVAEEGVYPALNSIEIEFFGNAKNKNKFPDLIFLHDENTEQITGTDKWLEKRPIERVFHIRENDETTLDRMIRIISGTSVGIVLNGGGAKGFAHIGVLMALQENNVPIDFIGGSSMGAIIGSGVLLMDIEQGLEWCEEFANSKFNDYTLPYLSLFKGEKISQSLKGSYGDLLIEDLWTPFFCVSCNLSKRKLEIHDSGPLFESVRSSISIPSVLPPIYLGDDIIVDGGVLNNLPVDVMRKKMRGGKIIAVNCNVEKEVEKSKTYSEPFISGWKIFFHNFFSGKNLKYENLLNIINSTISLASEKHEDQMFQESDYSIGLDTKTIGILEFQKYKEIIDLGYNQTISQLKNKPLVLD